MFEYIIQSPLEFDHRDWSQILFFFIFQATFFVLVGKFLLQKSWSKILLLIIIIFSATYFLTHSFFEMQIWNQHDEHIFTTDENGLPLNSPTHSHPYNKAWQHDH